MDVDLMFKLIQNEKKNRQVTIIDFGSLEFTEQFKKDLEKVRKEVKKGKFTKYNNVQELADELGL
jgi:hypothetical protein